MYIDLDHVYNLAEFCTKDAKVEMENKISHRRRRPRNKFQTNDEDKIYANINSYINAENIMKYSVYCTNCRTEMMSS